MSLVRLIYYSRVADAVKGALEQSVHDIITVATKRNRSECITGSLIYNDHYFLQCLEGDREKVNALYNHIAQDTRHTCPTLLSCTTIDERLFFRWDMHAMTDAVMLKHYSKLYMTGDTFDPTHLTSPGAEKLMAFAAKMQH